MDFLNSILDFFKGFFGWGSWNSLMNIIKSGDYSKLLTYDGFRAMLFPILPFLLSLEIIRAAFYKRFKVIHYKIPFFSFVLNSVIGRYISIGMVFLCIGLFEKHAFFKTTFTWYWFIYGYIVWEFGHFLYHYFGHKVRLFWCLHSTHHAPETMNLAISNAHFFLEGPYADFIRTTVCIMLGVTPPMLFVIMFIDGFWGTFIHIGENVMKDARLGFLNNILLTPSHHRVHHARNIKYMDTNFCNLLPIWDKVFGTYQNEEMEIPIEYGISRPLIKNSFLDAYFGEIVALVKDVYKAPGIKNKLLYIVMPPGWNHNGDHKMTTVVKKKYFEELEKQNANNTDSEKKTVLT
jgi:sterol desaturase/sphingolipid hydroxylase (fatty acid hydroxylase superfamily)